jgi:hypothetical protein
MDYHATDHVGNARQKRLRTQITGKVEVVCEHESEQALDADCCLPLSNGMSAESAARRQGNRKDHKTESPERIGLIVRSIMENNLGFEQCSSRLNI